MNPNGAMAFVAGFKIGFTSEEVEDIPLWEVI